MIYIYIYFFQFDRPTQYKETHSTLNEKKKKGGGVGGEWPMMTGSLILVQWKLIGSTIPVMYDLNKFSQTLLQ